MAIITPMAILSRCILRHLFRADVLRRQWQWQWQLAVYSFLFCCCQRFWLFLVKAWQSILTTFNVFERFLVDFTDEWLSRNSWYLIPEHYYYSVWRLFDLFVVVLGKNFTSSGSRDQKLQRLYQNAQITAGRLSDRKGSQIVSLEPTRKSLWWKRQVALRE